MIIPTLLVVGTLASVYAILATVVELGIPLIPGVAVVWGQPAHRGWRRIPRVA